jgi:hypothetical protein
MLRKEGPAAACVKTSYVDENGNDINKEDLADWIKPKRVGENDPVEFYYREYRTDHIVEIRMGGEVYVVEALKQYARTNKEAA